MQPVFKQFHNTVNQYNQLMKSIQGEKRVFGPIALYPSEVHTLVFIIDHPDDHFTQIASGLGITKGALTRLINKLLAKDLIVKISHPDNQKTIYYQPTQAGCAAYRAHDAFHRALNFQLNEDFEAFLRENEEVLVHFFDYTHEVMQQLSDRLEEME